MAGSKEYYRKNKEKMDRKASDYLTTPRGRAVQLVSTARARAKKHNMEFNLTIEHIFEILEIGRCQKSGLPFDLKRAEQTHRNGFAPSLDRTVNHRGYTMDNVAVVLNMYNSGKGETDDTDFIAMCVSVAKIHSANEKVVTRLKELTDGL
jgi:hypothetical protein